MADGVLVVLLLAFIWAAVLLPPAAGARASREAEFLGSIRPGGHPHDTGDPTGELELVEQPRFRPALTPNARRRQVLGGLVVAIGTTLVLGLMPPFRLLLVVHLLLVNSCLAYVGLLVHVRDEQAARSRAAASAGWRSDRRRSEGDFAEPVHPYAYSHGYGDSDEFGYGDPVGAYPDETAYSDDVAEPAAYAYAHAEGYSGDGYYAGSDAAEMGEAWADEEWDEDDLAAAAYVDEELALRRPA